MPRSIRAAPAHSEIVADFRRARNADLPRLLQLMAAYYAEDDLDFQPVRARRAALQLLRKPASGRIWFIRRAGAVVGYAVLTLGYSLEYGGPDAFVDELFVEEAHRGAGLGAQALEFLAGQARRLGVRELHLEVGRRNGRARGLYLRSGYRDHRRHLMSRPLR